MMAKKIDSKKKNAAAPKSAESTVPILDRKTTLTLVRVRPNGAAVYGIPGISGTVRVAKGLLASEPPASIEVTNNGFFKQPDPARAAKLAARGERVAKAQASLEERVAKAQKQLAKAAERTARAEARAAKLVARLVKSAPSAAQA